MSTTTKGEFYNLERLKAIPILNVCRTLGIEPKLNGGQYWCKLRNERTASTVLHLDTNTFYDFGSHAKGDVIQLVSEVRSIDRKEAIKVLANSFGISPENARGNLNNYELSDWEYRQIGLAPDRATKNFSFDIERQSIDRISEISEKYAMPMNELRKKHKFIYTKLLKEKALPHILDLRKEYYLALYSEYYLYKQIGAESAFANQGTWNNFRDGCIKELQTAEAIFIRACHGTEIKAHPVGEYDPAKDIEKLLSGELKPSLGNTDYIGMKQAAEKLNTKIKHQTIDFTNFRGDMLSNFTFSAFLEKGNVVVRYLECDREVIKPILDEMKGDKKKDLTSQIEAAKELQQTAAANNSQSRVKSNTEKER